MTYSRLAEGLKAAGIGLGPQNSRRSRVTDEAAFKSIVDQGEERAGRQSEIEKEAA
jgi:ribosomal protein L20